MMRRTLVGPLGLRAQDGGPIRAGVTGKRVVEGGGPS